MYATNITVSQYLQYLHNSKIEASELMMHCEKDDDGDNRTI